MVQSRTNIKLDSTPFQKFFQVWILEIILRYWITSKSHSKSMPHRLKWVAFSRWSSSLSYPMRNSDQMTIGKTHPTVYLVKQDWKCILVRLYGWAIWISEFETLHAKKLFPKFKVKYQSFLFYSNDHYNVERFNLNLNGYVLVCGHLYFLIWQFGQQTFYHKS